MDLCPAWDTSCAGRQASALFSPQIAFAENAIYSSSVYVLDACILCFLLFPSPVNDPGVTSGWLALLYARGGPSFSRSTTTPACCFRFSFVVLVSIVLGLLPPSSSALLLSPPSRLSLDFLLDLIQSFPAVLVFMI